MVIGSGRKYNVRVVVREVIYVFYPVAGCLTPDILLPMILAFRLRLSRIYRYVLMLKTLSLKIMGCAHQDMPYTSQTRCVNEYSFAMCFIFIYIRLNQ